ncbi:AsmA-like protein [Mesorhizobium sp. J18]|nr:AsmA-like protein [Mesorhizobium sp. J18]
MVVALLTAALIGPYFIDWTSYRGDFEREAGRILGRDVKVEGMARARFLPFPSVTFTDVTVAGDAPGEPAMTVEEFSMDAELAPFMRGEVLIFDMRLVRPIATIDIAEDGRIDWAVRPSTPFDPRQVSLEKVTITDGSITLHHRASGRTHKLTDINAELSARTIAGPWRIGGSLAIDGLHTALSASTGQLEEETGMMRIRIAARPENYPLALETDGQASIDTGGAALYAGTFRLRTVAEEDGRSRDEGSAQGPGNRVNGRFALDHQRLSFDEFRFETGPLEDPYTADGSAFIELDADPRFSVTADGAQIRFEEPAPGEVQNSGFALDKRLAVFRNFMLSLPEPTIPGTVELKLPAIVAGDTTIRDIRLEAEPAEEGWSIGSMAATLPGRTTFEGQGILRTRDRLGFAGSLVLAVKQPSGFAAWLAKDVDDAIRRLPAAGFSADVDITEERQVFSNLELILGSAHFRGSIERQQPVDARASVSVILDGDQLDVEGMAAFASLFVSDEGENRLVDHDVDLQVTAGPVNAAGLTAESVDTALRMREGMLEVDRLRINGLAGANVSATGTLEDFPNASTGKIDATVVAVDLAPLVETLAERFPNNPVLRKIDQRAKNYPGLLEDAEVDLVASAAENGNGTSGMAVSAEGRAGGTSFSFAGSGNGTLEDMAQAPLSLNFSARNEEAAALYALYGIPSVPLGFAGAADTELSAKGTLQDGLQTSFGFSGEDLKARFEGVVSPLAETAKGKASVVTGDLEPWLAVAAVTLPGFGLGLPVELGADIDLRDGRLAMTDLQGGVADKAVSGALQATLKDGKPHFTGSLDLEVFDLWLPVAMVLGDAALEGTLDSTWPRAPFRDRSGAPFGADVQLTAGTFYVGEAVKADVAAMNFRLDEEGFAVSDLIATMNGGKLGGLIELKNNDGTGLLAAQLKLDGAEIGALLPNAGLSGQADLTTSVTASGKTIEGLVAGLAGSGSVTVEDLMIDGINPDAFGPMIQRADAIGREVDAKDAAAFAPELVRRGSFEAGAVQAAFTVASGVARIPPLQLKDGGTVLSVETRADLTKLEAAAEGTIAYDPGLQAVAGSEPAIRFAADGPLGAMQVRLETEPLAQYFTQRALEREQARVEHMQAVLLEKQRLRREERYYAALEETRIQVAEEQRRLAREAERLRQEAERARREAEARARAAEEERLRAEAERKARAEEEAERKAREAERLQLAPVPAPSSSGNRQEGATIERAPLPAPEAGRRNDSQLDLSGDEVENFFRQENLSVDGLMDLLDPQSGSRSP